MTSKKTKSTNLFDKAASQLPPAHSDHATVTYFVDQPSSYQTGPYVTKLTFGVIDDDGSDFPRPVLTLAIPTVNLIRMVKDLQEVIKDSEFKEHNLATIKEDLKIYYEVSSPPRKRLSTLKK